MKKERIYNIVGLIGLTALLFSLGWTILDWWLGIIFIVIFWLIVGLIKACRAGSYTLTAMYIDEHTDDET